MAHRRQPSYSPTARGIPCLDVLRPSNERPRVDDEESVLDVDEPPDEKIHFSRLHNPNYPKSFTPSNYLKASPQNRRATPSLLTQALLTPPKSTHWSDSEVRLPPSAKAMLNPTSSSPPRPNANVTPLSSSTAKSFAQDDLTPDARTTHPHQGNEGREKPAEATVEACLGRPRCITFACGRQVASSKISETGEGDEASKTNVSPKPSRLRFSCHMKLSSGTHPKVEPDTKPSKSLQTASSSSKRHTMSGLDPSGRGSELINENSPKSNASGDTESRSHNRKSPVFIQEKLEFSESIRFHEFAERYQLNDPWMDKPIDLRQKMTVEDTLRKENTIRKLAEEAEEEALDEDGEQEAEPLDNLGDLDDDDVDEFASDDDSSDGGNESDDEEGFADSDDDSDHSSHYEFWTAGLTTAATSLDYMEHIRPLTERCESDSSLGSILNPLEAMACHRSSTRHSRGGHRTRRSPKMRPGTPDLPDSTDFVCGTLDEDRPREAAYMSCLEERRRSRHKIVPQDIDPSFPTSDPEAEDDVDDNNAISSDENVWVMGRPDNSDDEQKLRKRKHTSKKMAKSPMPSPKRARSPAPRRGPVHRSPPPRKLFGQSPGNLQSVITFHQKPNSPPSTRRTSFCNEPGQKAQVIKMSHLAQRPHLTHTTSLPRTPNPFWRQHREARDDTYGPSSPTRSAWKAEMHHRGPIEIVTGLESRRQRRKEKLWRQHCRYAGKEKERRCQPGKGAERMKELGLEMANRARDYGQKPELVLSV